MTELDGWRLWLYSAGMRCAMMLPANPRIGATLREAGGQRRAADLVQALAQKKPS